MASDFHLKCDAKLWTKKRRRNFHSIAVKFLKVFLKVLAFQRVFLKVFPILAPFSVKFLKVFEGFSESFTVFDQFLRKVSPFLTNYFKSSNSVFWAISLYNLNRLPFTGASFSSHSTTAFVKLNTSNLCKSSTTGRCP